MNSFNLPDKLLSGLELQKEYISLQIEEKAVRLLTITALALAFQIAGTTFFYYWLGAYAAICFVVVSLLIVSWIGYRRQRAISHIRKSIQTDIKASQTLLKEHFIELTTPPDTILQLCQTIRTITDIIHELKILFKGKG